LEGGRCDAAGYGLDDRAGGEVLEVEVLLVAGGVGDLEEAVFRGQGIHGLDGGGDHGLDDLEGRGAVGAALGLGDGDVGGEVFAEDVGGRPAVGPLDLDFHIQAPGAQDGRVDEVLAAGGAEWGDVRQAP